MARPYDAGRGNYAYRSRLLSRCTWILPFASSHAIEPGVTTVVVSYSSISSGPGRGVTVRSDRESTGVLIHPAVLPKYAVRRRSRKVEIALGAEFAPALRRILPVTRKFTKA